MVIDQTTKDWEAKHALHAALLSHSEVVFPKNHALQKLVTEFQDRLEAAEKLDEFLKQPDCEHTIKVQLLLDVAENIGGPEMRGKVAQSFKYE
ncbi:MAG: hypothetical protein AAF434_17265 [Pseudomonadota bacterium]